MKLTDFGLAGLRAESRTEAKHSHEFYRAKLWTAPELLRADSALMQFYNAPAGPAPPPAPPPQPGPQADIYSFAIILHEVRNLPP